MQGGFKLFLILLIFPKAMVATGYNFDNINMLELMDIWAKKQHHYYSIELNGVHLPGTRPWDVRWEKIKTATDFTGKRVLDIGTSIGLCPIFLSKQTSCQKIVAFDCESDAVYTANKLMKIFDVNYELLKIDLDKDPYEQILGYEYDIVICMSVFNWINKKEQLLNYLQHFNEVIFEGHDGTLGEINRLKALGFKNIKILGAVDRNRDLIYCAK